MGLSAAYEMLSPSAAWLITATSMGLSALTFLGVMTAKPIPAAEPPHKKSLRGAISMVQRAIAVSAAFRSVAPATIDRRASVAAEMSIEAATSTLAGAFSMSPSVADIKRKRDVTDEWKELREEGEGVNPPQGSSTSLV